MWLSIETERSSTPVAVSPERPESQTLAQEAIDNTIHVGSL